jgi:E3 ubiquitin-protein ligase DOA10
MAPVYTYVVLRAWNKENIHPIVKMLLVSMYLQLTAILFGVIHYAKYTEDGVGIPPFAAFSEAFQTAARLSFALMLILVAQGWTVTTNVVRNKNQVIFLMGFFVFAYSLLVVWDATGMCVLTCWLCFCLLCMSFLSFFRSSSSCDKSSLTLILFCIFQPRP